MSADCSFELSRSQIHLWTFATEPSNGVAPIFERLLVTEETDRAARFRFSHLRESFVIARGTLRYLLGRYLNSNPSNIRLVYGSNGKPALPSGTGVEFNMTHSGRLAVIALTLGRQIGVDVEQIRPLSDLQQIADRFFCPEEASDIMSLPETERERAFFRCWTRKEAYIKAIGDGLSAPLDSFRVTVQEPARFVHIQHDTRVAQAWTLHDLQLASGYTAALAYCDRQQSLALFPILDLREFVDLP